MTVLSDQKHKRIGCEHYGVLATTTGCNTSGRIVWVLFFFAFDEKRNLSFVVWKGKKKTQLVPTIRNPDSNRSSVCSTKTDVHSHNVTAVDRDSHTVFESLENRDRYSMPSVDSPDEGPF